MNEAREVPGKQNASGASSGTTDGITAITILAGKDKEQQQPELPRPRKKCCKCNKITPTSSGHTHRGAFYCDTCVWELAEAGEFYCG